MKPRTHRKDNQQGPEEAEVRRDAADALGAPPPEEAELTEETPAEQAGTGEPTEGDPATSLEADLMKWRELAMRTSADLENYRKRVARDKEEAMRYANQSLLEELLPILDNFEMGMQAAAGEEGSMIYIGMDMVRKQFAEFLANHGVVPIEVNPGDEFDHSTQEAVSQEPSDEIEAGRVLRVMRRGFKIHDRLLRPATVVVSSGPEGTQAEAGNEDVNAEDEG